MRRLLALLVLLTLFAAVPATEPLAAPVKKPAKQRACEKKAKRIKSKKKRKAAMKKCAKKYAPRAPAKAPVVTPAAPAAAAAPAAFSEGGIGDATVVAVLDTATNPYHFDFRGSMMPQHKDADPGNDLPLDRPFTEWLPGAANAPLASLEPLNLTLPDDPEEKGAGLASSDGKLDKIQASEVGKVHAYYIPGTKIIGAASFENTPNLYQGDSSHGVGTTSSSVGNLHGTCPECLLFFVNYGETPEEGEAAIDWVMQQPWIDAISNSYGYSIAVRDRVYSGSNTEQQRAASERGQTVFFSAGNGNDGSFMAPNTTEFSSQEGPDWIVTVGAVSAPESGFYDPIVDTSDSDGQSSSYTGAGKPADVAGVGEGYPTAYYSASIGGTGSSGFGGTSNATPQVAGLYARALYLARTALPGPSRTQAAGLVATGSPIVCGAARPDCELADGKLTAAELRTRLFHGAVHTGAGMGVYTQGAADNPSAPPLGEDEFLNEGHGSYMGRVGKDRNEWLDEFKRIIGPLVGTEKALERPAGEQDWMIVDSYCRQKEWGSWTQGYYLDGVTTLPGPDPAWPVRSYREQTCLGGPA
jgi:hypothetical protein